MYGVLGLADLPLDHPYADPDGDAFPVASRCTFDLVDGKFVPADYNPTPVRVYIDPEADKDDVRRLLVKIVRALDSIFSINDEILVEELFASAGIFPADEEVENE